MVSKDMAMVRARNMLRALLFGADPVVPSHFVFMVEGDRVGAFSEITGLGAQVETETISEGGQNEFVHQRPSGITWNNITLRRGVTKNEFLYDWFKESSGEGFSANRNRVALKNCVIQAMDARRNVIREWELADAFPVRWEGPTLSADASDVAVEELELAHHGLRTSYSR